jgi:hypothetical protein
MVTIRFLYLETNLSFYCHGLCVFLRRQLLHNLVVASHCTQDLALSVEH